MKISTRQQELREQYRQHLAANVWQKDPKMVDFCLKECAHIVELHNGILTISKPRIEKDFCFGYSDSSISTADYDRANAMVSHARNSREYFMRENLRNLNSILNSLRDESCKAYTDAQYTRTESDPLLRHLVFREYWQAPYEGLEEITAEDRAALVDGYEQVKAAFVKRLETYLKRYGLSKVNAWSYWRDA